MANIIEAKNLTRKYGEFIAVNDLTFDVARAEIFGFLGPNGAGKTTTINMLTGMARITAGRVYYNSVDVTRDIKKAQEIIGIVADESNLYDEMSGFDNLCFCGSLYGITKKDREYRATRLLEEFQLKDVSKNKFRNYSKGMKRKLTIAAALIHDPQILFLDEPTSGIDITSVRQIREMIKRLNKNGTTVFLTTHYIEEAERLCNRVAFINKGEIIKIDTVGNLINATEEDSIVEVVFESYSGDINELIGKLGKRFPGLDCRPGAGGVIRLTASDKIDISPVVNFLSMENIFITEARLLRPALEDAFVKMTGIEPDIMKKEKEKK
jgi:ABC-2 type transport system ATP-binding protein